MGFQISSHTDIFRDTEEKLLQNKEKNENGKEGEIFLTTVDELPVDDSSPITCAEIVQKCMTNLPSLSTDSM